MLLRRVVLVAFFLLVPTSGYGIECGDHDASGSIGTSDALRVLRRSVGLPAPLQCPAGPCSTSTTGTFPGDECFTNADCELKDPSLPFCDFFECRECIFAQHCPDGEICNAYQCTPE
jgi:hypothetical protein